MGISKGWERLARRERDGSEPARASANHNCLSHRVASITRSLIENVLEECPSPKRFDIERSVTSNDILSTPLSHPTWAGMNLCVANTGPVPLGLPTTAVFRKHEKLSFPFVWVQNLLSLSLSSDRGYWL